MPVKNKLIAKLLFVTILLFSSSISHAMITSDQTNQNRLISLKNEISVKEPIISSLDSDKTIISIPSIDTYLTNPGEPRLPIIKKTYTFPKGTSIQQISCNPTNKIVFQLDHPIRETPNFQSISGNRILTNKGNNPYNLDTYPQNWFSIQTGTGITPSGNHVLYLTLTIYPIKYHPIENAITYASDFNLDINYILPHMDNTQIKNYNDSHKLVIITPETYVQTLDSFVNHKQNYDLNPIVKTTNEIYDEFEGRDKPEKIKYFVKHAIETFDTKFVLLIGDITQLPIRQTDAYPWGPYHGTGILTDLYYADIYDASNSFASWDTNNNDVFGEVDFTDYNIPPDSENIIDEVDLYPDVHLGRIPCSTTDELTTVISKIITYEQITAYQNWFNKILLAGGDTFPLCKFSPPNIFEGEITNVKVGQQIPEFSQIRLWTSERTLNARTFNQAISEGVGFVSYAGHGFEHGWGTYRPNAILKGNLISYLTPFLKFLDNEHRLPIVFFDACLTTKLDFNISDLKDYFGLKARLYSILLGFDNSEKYYPSFAWSFLKLEDGGGIATIGATRPAYTYVDKDGVYAGAGFLDVRFFSAYEEGVTVGEMLSQAQTDYQNYVGKDMFTIEEYILLGDPSLKVGGYL